jgi:DNA-binding IclR family transcriptional regulator
MGVPIFNNLGQAIASFGIPVPSQRFDKEKEKVIGEALKSSGESLSRQLGHFIKR